MFLHASFERSKVTLSYYDEVKVEVRLIFVKEAARLIFISYRHLIPLSLEPLKSKYIPYYIFVKRIFYKKLES